MRKFRVNILEFERGWDSIITEVVYFNSKKDAENYVVRFNSHNDSPEVPDWYMIAEMVGWVKVKP